MSTSPILPSPSPPSSFLRLPLPIRQKIYAYLLSPQNDITTINYNLEWPFLQNPHNSTFTPHKLDICHCPSPAPHTTNPQSTHHHIYTRPTCRGPNVRFTPQSAQLWLLTQPNPNKPYNILRPATQDERKRRPEAAIILTNKQCYQEALPLLYRNRNFLFLSGPCPRGRYQAYATQMWLRSLTPFARACVTHLSLICQTWEEDCETNDAVRAYTEFSRYLLDWVPGLRSLCLNHWSREVPVNTFGMLFAQEGLRIYVCCDFGSGGVEEFCDVEAWVGRYVGWYKAPRDKMVGHGKGGSDEMEMRLGVTESEDKKGEASSDNRVRKLSLADDWVFAELSPMGSGGGSDSEIWELL